MAVLNTINMPVEIWERVRSGRRCPSRNHCDLPSYGQNQASKFRQVCENHQWTCSMDRASTVPKRRLAEFDPNHRNNGRELEEEEVMLTLIPLANKLRICKYQVFLHYGEQTLPWKPLSKGPRHDKAIWWRPKRLASPHHH